MQPCCVATPSGLHRGVLARHLDSDNTSPAAPSALCAALGTTSLLAKRAPEECMLPFQEEQKPGDTLEQHTPRARVDDTRCVRPQLRPSVCFGRGASRVCHRNNPSDDTTLVDGESGVGLENTDGMKPAHGSSTPRLLAPELQHASPTIGRYTNSSGGRSETAGMLVYEPSSERRFDRRSGAAATVR
jgi:hypothetical protein